MRFLERLRAEAGALWIVTLAFLAGALNTAGLLRFGQTLSHMTGNLTKLGLALSGKAQTPAWWLLLFLLCFMLGALVSGFAFPRVTRSQWKRCGQVLMAGGLLLLLPLALNLPELAQMLALALVLGAQNGLALRYRGTLMRTTHVTGHLTDVGAALGRLIHTRQLKGEDLRELFIHLSCLLSFLLGAVLASIYPNQTGPGLTALALCALLYMFLGFGILCVLWFRYRSSD